MADPTAVELGPDDADDYRELYREFEWWADRDRADVERALEHTPLAVGLCDGDQLVAAARVLTDFVYYAKIYDVIVSESRRRDGLGDRLMQSVVEHPSLDGITLQLDCREGLVGFYERCGFELWDATTTVEGSEERFVPMAHRKGDETGD